MALPRAYIPIEIDGYGLFEVLGNCTEHELKDLAEGGLMADACRERAQDLRLAEEPDVEEIAALESPEHAEGCEACQTARQRLGRFLSLHFKSTPSGFDLSTPERALAFLDNRDGSAPGEATELIFHLVAAARRQRKEQIAKNLGLPSSSAS